MSQRRRYAAPATKADALAKVARLERWVRSLERRLARSERRGDDAVRDSEDRPRALAAAHERETATSEIVRMISSAPTDLQPVFDAVARISARLCGATEAHVYRVEGHTMIARGHPVGTPQRGQPRESGAHPARHSRAAADLRLPCRRGGRERPALPRDRRQRARETAPGLVVLDLMMPEMDGFDFVTEFRRHEDWRAVPIIVVTAKDVSDEDRERLNGGVERILQKGAYSRDALLREVRNLVAACVARQGRCR